MRCFQAAALRRTAIQEPGRIVDLALSVAGEVADDDVGGEVKHFFAQVGGSSAVHLEGLELSTDPACLHQGRMIAGPSPRLPVPRLRRQSRGRLEHERLLSGGMPGPSSSTAMTMQPSSIAVVRCAALPYFNALSVALR